MSYAGDVTCKDCWDLLRESPDAQLIDVRTAAEWAFVGLPFLEELGKEVLLVEWQSYPAMEVNSGFVSQVSSALGQMGSVENAPLYTLCRSGARSISAAQALTAAGYNNVYNVLGGFEGNSNEMGHRGSVSGWKYDNLPWRQR